LSDSRSRPFRGTLFAALLVTTISEFAGAQAFETHLANLKSPNAQVRRRAAQELGKLKDREAIAPLAEAVRDPEIDVRLAVVRALADIRDLSGVPATVVAMSDGQARVRQEAIQSVVAIYTRRARPSNAEKFLALFSDERPGPEPLLVSSVDSDVMRALAERLKDTEASTREQAAQAIGILGGSEAARDLASALSDRNAAVRSAAAFSIAKVGTTADGEALIPLLADPSGGVRRRAIDGLGALRVGDASLGLRRVFDKDRESDEGIAALMSLSRIALPSDQALFERYALESEPRRRRASVEALARLGVKAHEARFKRDFQREKNDELRATYAFALFSFGDRPFLDTVVLGLAGSGDRRRQSSGYLIELGGRAAPEVFDYVREPDAKIRGGLAEAFGAARLVEATTALERMSKDSDPEVVDAAVRALARIRRGR
jgi:HEAT repeat protein